MCGEDPDYSKRDLWGAIERGEDPEWIAYVQVMQPEQADPDILGFDPFDVTKVWPREQFPLQEFGRLKLNKNPENFTRDVEQAAFSPGSMVPGVEVSPDPLLQFRMFFYRDAQYHRIGVNLHQIPVNCPFMAGSFASLNFDGPIRTDANHAGNPQYTPNSFKDKFRPDVAEAPYVVSDNVVSRKSHYWHEGKMNDYAQATALWTKVMTTQQRENTCHNTAKYLSYVEYPEVQVRLLFLLFIGEEEMLTVRQKKYLAQLDNISPDYAEGVYRRLKEPKFSLEEVQSMPKDALLWGRNKKFMPSTNERLAGFAPSAPIYNTGF